MKLSKVQIGKILSQFPALVLSRIISQSRNSANCLVVILSFSTTEDLTCWSCSKFLGWRLRKERWWALQD